MPETNIIFFFSQRVQVKKIRVTQRNLQGFWNLQLSFTHCDYQFQLTSITVWISISGSACVVHCQFSQFDFRAGAMSKLELKRMGIIIRVFITMFLCLVSRSWLPCSCGEDTWWGHVYIYSWLLQQWRPHTTFGGEDWQWPAPRNVSKSLATSAGLEQLGKLYWEWIPAASWSSTNWKMAKWGTLASSWAPWIFGTWTFPKQ